MIEGDNLTGHVGAPNPACGKLLKNDAYKYLHYNAIEVMIKKKKNEKVEL